MVVSLSLLVAGCGGHSNVQFSSSGAPSTGVSSGGSVHLQGSATFATLLAIGILAGASYASGQYGDQGPMRHRSSPFLPLGRNAPAPELDASRRVVEQDCTRPIEDWSANLKCK